MKLLKVTYEHRAYTEDEAKDAILKFRNEAKNNGYLVQSAGYTYKSKKKKGDASHTGSRQQHRARADSTHDDDDGTPDPSAHSRRA